MSADTLSRISGLVIELHAKSGENWSRFRLRMEDGQTLWATAKFGVQEGEVVVADATYNDKFRSYDVKSLVDQGDVAVSNEVVKLQLINRLPGVGAKKAARLGEKFADLFKAITEDPDGVAEFCGATPEDVRSIAEILTQERGHLSRISELVRNGWPQHLARIAAKNDTTYRAAVKNPYAAIRHVAGLGWLIADEIGRKQGIQLDDPDRIKAGINHHYREKVIGDGHTIVHLDDLLSPPALPALLGVIVSKITAGIDAELIPLGDGWYTTDFQRRNASAISLAFLG